jgi:hypothetical protein
LVMCPISQPLSFIGPLSDPRPLPCKSLPKSSPWVLRTGESGEQNWAIESGQSEFLQTERERVRRSFYWIAISSIFSRSANASYLEDHNFPPFLLRSNGHRGIYFFYLVFGKTVRVRHYPVTVSVKSLAIDSKPLERKFWEGCPSSKRRKSGDRPDRIRA